MPSADHEHDVADVQFAGSDQFAVIVVDVNFTAPLPDDQDFGRADEVTLKWAMHMAGNLTARRIDDVADLLLKFGRREEGGLIRR